MTYNDSSFLHRFSYSITISGVAVEMGRVYTVLENSPANSPRPAPRPACCLMLSFYHPGRSFSSKGPLPLDFDPHSPLRCAMSYHVRDSAARSCLKRPNRKTFPGEGAARLLFGGVKVNPLGENHKPDRFELHRALQKVPVRNSPET